MITGYRSLQLYLCYKHVRIRWKAQEAGNETGKNVVDRINLIDQLVSQKIVVEDEPIAA